VLEGSWPVPKIFGLIEEKGPVARDEMYRTFNMGLGLMAVASESEVDKIKKAAAQAKEKVYVVGRIVKGSGSVKIVPAKSRGKK